MCVRQVTSNISFPVFTILQNTTNKKEKNILFFHSNWTQKLIVLKTSVDELFILSSHIRKNIFSQSHLSVPATKCAIYILCVLFALCMEVRILFLFLLSFILFFIVLLYYVNLTINTSKKLFCTSFAEILPKCKKLLKYDFM